MGRELSILIGMSALRPPPVAEASSTVGDEVASLTSSRWLTSLRRSAALRPGALSRHRFTSCRHASALASLVPAAVVCAITAHIKSPATVNFLSATVNLPSATVNLPSAPVNLPYAPLIWASAAVGKLSAPVILPSAPAAGGFPTAADTCLSTASAFPTAADGWLAIPDAKPTGAWPKFAAAPGKFTALAAFPAAASHFTRAARASSPASVAFLPHAQTT